MEQTRTDAVFSRLSMVLLMCRNKSSRNDLKLHGLSSHVRLYYTTQAFFSTSAMQLGRQLYAISGSTCYSPPRWAANFPRRYALGLTRKWTLRNNKWDVIIITGQLLCTKHVISLKNILFLEFENFNFITCCARNISLDFNVIQLYFEIIFNLTRNFG